MFSLQCLLMQTLICWYWAVLFVLFLPVLSAALLCYSCCEVLLMTVYGIAKNNHLTGVHGDVVIKWRDGAVGSVSDLRSRTPSWVPLLSNLGQVIDTYVPLSPSSIIWHWRWWRTAGKVTVGVEKAMTVYRRFMITVGLPVVDCLENGINCGTYARPSSIGVYLFTFIWWRRKVCLI